MITTYCQLCNKTITVETNPLPKENINPTTGHLICYNCFNNNFSIEILRNKKIKELLKTKQTPQEKIKKLWKNILTLK